MPRPRRRLRPNQNTFCRGYRCRGMCRAAQLYCRRCWRSLPELTRERFGRVAVFLAEHPEDEAANSCYAALLDQAARELEEYRRAAAS